MNARKTTALLLLCLSTAARVCAQTENFDTLETGPLAGWMATKTGSGSPRWTVEKEHAAASGQNVLKQSGVATYPICIKQGTSLRDGFVEVKFKAVSGKDDQASGVIWRCVDADNYYVARANALEDNVTLYHTISGRRVSFKSADTKVAPGVWHTLRVEFFADRFVVVFNGKKVIEARDDTISSAGMVGVWTKADSVTLFDDFSYGTNQP